MFAWQWHKEHIGSAEGLEETLIFTWSQKKPLSHSVFSVTAHKVDTRS